MTSHASSLAAHPPRSSLQRQIVSRRLPSLSTAEFGHNGAQGMRAEEHEITKEIEEIKRYEDFTTIDWVQDAAKEQSRKRARKERSACFDHEGRCDWRTRLGNSYDAGQAWLVITIVGVVIGLIAAFLNIITEWLSDIKLGYCRKAFYLNEQFCCWGAENGCPEWHHWSSWSPVSYAVYICFAAVFAWTSATLVKSYAPYAAGSGISEIKCIVAGFVMKGFLGFWTLLIKSIGLPLAIASGLSIGKEGPSVHYAVCVGNVISRVFSKYKRSAAKTREILTATAGTGVAVAFGSPIGGVLFALEEISPSFPLKTMWRTFFCALVATSVLSAMNPFRTGQLVMFSVKYDRTWHFFELIFFVVLGIFGGIYGIVVIKWNLRYVAFRKKYLSKFAVGEAVLLAVATAILCYPNMFLRIDMTESMEILFQECEGAHDYRGLCQPKNRARMIVSLSYATIVRTLFLIISYGAKVPAGCFVPSMAIGATFGRMVGILVQALHDAFPDSRFFAACEPDVQCITPGTYAFLGAGAALSGIMNITITVVVIMFELTGALTYILPTMIVVGVTKAITDRFGKGGIADRMIWFSGFPFLDNKEEHSFGVPVSQVMTSDITVLPAQGLGVRTAEQLLDERSFSGFPIVQDKTSRILIGYVGRTEFRYAIDRAKRQALLSPTATCIFSNSEDEEEEDVLPRTPVAGNSPAANPSTTFAAIASSSGIRSIDFCRFVNYTPLTVHPRLPLETVMEIFKKMGPRVILVEHRGKLLGLVTVKDCLKYQFKAEAEEHSRDHVTEEQRQEWLWRKMHGIARWILATFMRSGSIRTAERQGHHRVPLRENGHVGNEEATAVELQVR